MILAFIPRVSSIISISENLSYIDTSIMENPIMPYISIEIHINWKERWKINMPYTRRNIKKRHRVTIG